MARNKSEKVASPLEGVSPELLDYLRDEALNSNVGERHEAYTSSGKLRVEYQALRYTGRVKVRQHFQREAGREVRTDGMHPDLRFR